MKPIKSFVIVLSIVSLLLVFNAYAVVESKTIDASVQSILDQHVTAYKDKEYFSGAALSLFIPDDTMKHFYAGYVSHDAKSKKVGSDTLFHIGSISKSFTAAILLQLEKEGAFSLDDKIGVSLPGYAKWSSVKMKELVNMTSGLPNYTDTPLWNTKEYENISRRWTERELIDFVYPKQFNPPIRTGYFYTNTGYVLAGMLIEKATHSSFTDVITEKMIKVADLRNTVYPVPKMDRKTQSRLAHGYNFNPYDNPSLVGRDMYLNNLSWGGAAGGVVSNTEDIIKWVHALFVGTSILDDAQKQKLMQLVSTTTGQPIEKATKEDPRGFGLGVMETYREGIGRFWFYEGETLGFRAIYMYKPCNGVIISAILNSATHSSNDSIGLLLQQVYTRVLEEYPTLRCDDDKR